MEKSQTPLTDHNTRYEFDWYYKILDVPEMPEHFHQKLMDLYRMPDKDHLWINYFTSDGTGLYNDQLRPDLAKKPGSGDVVGTGHNGERIGNARGRRYKMDQEIVDWCNKHIHDNYNDVGLFVMDGSVEHTMLPHSDQTRSLVAIYTLDSGGKNAWTGYWQEDGYEINRELREFGLDYRKLKLRHKVQWPIGKWVVMNTNILHSVEEMDSDRIAIQMGLLEFPNALVGYTEYIK